MKSRWRLERILGLTILIVLAALAGCGPNPRPAAPETPGIDRFVLRVSADGALALDDQPVARREMAARAGRLAEWVRVKARASGHTVGPADELPAVLGIEAAGSTPFSAIASLANEFQAAGFRRWAFAPIDGFSGPPSSDPEGPTFASRGESRGEGLADESRTAPVRLRAHDAGTLERLELGEHEFAQVEAFQAELAKLLVEPDLAIDRAMVRVDARLAFSEFLRVIRVF